MKIRPSALQTDVLLWGAIGVTALGLGYLVIKYAVPAITKAARDSAAKAAGDITGGVADVAQSAIQGLDTNTLTQQGPDTGFGGQENHDYTGFGALSTPAALANKATGGLLADVGDKIGGFLFDTFGGGGK